MKTLYALSGSLIVVLTLAAFNPDTVVDMYEVAKIRLVEMPRAIENLNQQVRAAEDGNMYAQYDIAWYHLSSSKWHVPAYYADVLGPKDPAYGRAMMKDAAEAGHAEALYMLARHGDHDDMLFREALEAGSLYAIGQAWRTLSGDLCDEKAYEQMMIVARRADHDGYPWTGTSPWLSSADAKAINEQRQAWWSETRSNLTKVDSLRAERCPAAAGSTSG